MNAGMVLVYRRPDSPFTTARFLLKGLADGCCCHLEPTANNCLLLEGNVLEVNFSKAPAAIAVFYCVTQDCNDF
jgi:hypothetical protein